MKRSAIGVLVAALSSLMLALVVMPAATAHSDLLSSDPPDGSVLDSPPSRVLLRFSEELLPDTVTLSVEDETGFVVRVLSFTVDGADVIVDWPPGVPGRALALNYRVVSQDGHPISGAVRFTVGPASAGSSSAPAQQPGSTSNAPGSASADSVAPLAAIVTGLGIAIALGAVLLLRRRSPR